jgi:hypothetical protein
MVSQLKIPEFQMIEYPTWLRPISRRLPASSTPYTVI